MSSISKFHQRLDALTSQWDGIGHAEIQLKWLELSRQASAKERGLWALVRNRHPGQPDHDPAAWKEWSEAANEVRVLAEKMRELRGT